MKPLYFSASIVLYTLLFSLVSAQSPDNTFDQLRAELQKARAEVSELKKENQQLKGAPALAYQKQVDRLASRHRLNMRRMDSLLYELESAKRVIATLSKVEKVEKQRYAQLEERERSLLEYESWLQKQSQLIKTRESNLNRNSVSEEEHQELIKKLRDQQKKLKLLEQQLRMANSANTSVGK